MREQLVLLRTPGRPTQGQCVQIRTKRLILRRARVSDLEDVNAYMGDPVAMRYWSTPPHPHLGHTRAWLSNMVGAPPRISEDYLIVLDGRVIGEAGSFPLPEFGFILHPEYWGRGIAYEASSAVISQIFRSRTIEALTADVDPRNESSIRLLTKLGFQKIGQTERTHLVGEEWVDSVHFRLARPVAA